MTTLFSSFCLLLLPFTLAGDSEIFDKAEELYSATLFKEAIPLYLSDNNEETKSISICRVGQAYFYQNNYSEALTWFAKCDPSTLSDEIREDNVFFTALCHCRLENYDKVIAVLENVSLPKYQQEVYYELGLAFYFQQQFAEASKWLLQISDFNIQNQLYFLARFYLVRIALNQHSYTEAQKLLDDLTIPESDLLQREWAYLKGECCFFQKKYSDAVKYFESSILNLTEKQNLWIDEAFYKIGWSYLEMIEEVTTDMAYALKQAKNAFSSIKNQDSSRIKIAKAKYTLLDYTHLNNRDDSFIDEISDLLSEVLSGEDKEYSAQALVLKAELAKNYEEKSAIYKLLTEEKYANSPYYAKGWYLKGLSEYEEAKKTHSEFLYHQAAKSFKLSAAQFPKSDPEYLQSLQCEVTAYLDSGSLNSLLSAFETISEPLQEQVINDQLDTLFGTVLIEIASKHASEKVIKQGEAILKQRCISSPTPLPLLCLAELYFKQEKYEESKKTFLKIVERYPDSEKVSMALFRASLALEYASNSDIEEVRKLRKKIYREFPYSESAPLAYFNTYSYQEYLQGDRAAIKHLNEFKNCFPDSPLLINSFYLLGLDFKRDRRTLEGKWVRKKSPFQALQAFVNAETTFERLKAENKIPEESKSYFSQLRYRSVLERALIYFSIAEESSSAKKDIYLQYCIGTLDQLKNMIESGCIQENAIINRYECFPLLHEECLYWLGLANLKADQEAFAINIFNFMLKKYTEADVTKGYYLSRIHYQLGVLAQNKQDYISSLKEFNLAEEASQGRFLSVDEKLDLWLKQSVCHQAMDQLENAMIILSKVINDDSISHLRLMAMFKRAELYEKLGRLELARRQLEFVAKMDGEWAEQAKFKLEHHYAKP